jgi:hypothetical protein
VYAKIVDNTEYDDKESDVMDCKNNYKKSLKLNTAALWLCGE